MYIESIELINVRSYKRAKVELSKGINLLIGKNNSGKSTIIRAAYYLQSRQALHKSDIRKLETAGRIFINLVDLNPNDKKLFFNQNTSSLKFNSENQTVYFGLLNENTSDDAKFFDSKLSVRFDNNTLIIKNKKSNQNDLKLLPFFPEKENENNFIYPYLAKRKTDYYDTQSGKEEMYRVSESLRNLAAKIQKVSNPSHFKNEEFVKLCSEILGFKIGVIGSESNGHIDTGIMIKDGETISIKSMGEGVANILGLIVILLTEDNKLYLIEEIENDIHPEALKKLLELIAEKSKTNQFLISTHSHIVLKYLGGQKDSKLFFTEWSPNDSDRNNYKNIPTTSIHEIENKPENRIEVLRKLGFELSDFELYQSYLLLEESSAEQIIRDFLIPNFVPSLYGKIKIIAAKGVDDLQARVVDFARLMVFLHTSPIYNKKTWVIADGDEAGKDCISNLKEKFQSWPQNNFLNFSQNNFELYYPEKFKDKVNSIFKIQDRRKRNDEKNKLIGEVMNWALHNRDEAIIGFQKSAKDVIDLLKKINNSLK